MVNIFNCLAYDWTVGVALSVYEALIYVPSYRKVVCLIRPAQRFEGVIQLSGEHMTPCLYSGVKSHIKQAVRISSEIV
jgi:hypothetical protein